MRIGMYRAAGIYDDMRRINVEGRHEVGLGVVNQGFAQEIPDYAGIIMGVAR